MPIAFLPAFDHARRTDAPDTLWGIWQPVMGAYADRYAPSGGRQYGRMEAQEGHCERYPDATSSNCEGWHTRVRKLPLEHNTPDEPRREKNLIDCQRDDKGRTRCTISASGAHFTPDGSLTITLYVRKYDLQYRARFSNIGEYLQNAISARGLDPATLRKEMQFLRATLLKLPETARIPALAAFTGEQQNDRLPSLASVADTYLASYPALPHNLSPDAGRSSLVSTITKTR